MKRLLFCGALLVWHAVPAKSLAQVDADPAKEYLITPEAGSWMIVLPAYVGPKAPELAHEMILELRSRFKMPAYLLNRGDEERRKQEAEFKRVKETYDALNQRRLENKEPEVPIPKRLMPHVQEQCAVLVGGYKDMDAAYRALKEVKKLPEPSNKELCPILTQVPTDTSPNGQKSEVGIAYANPFVSSFVVRNPTVPHERKNEDKNDPFLKKLNAKESYNLLKCDKHYTILVAVFKGLHTFQPVQAENQGFFEKIWSGNTGELLDASGQNAHNMAEALRKLQFQAYVLHMREGSAVTIGGFDREDDPQIRSIEEALATRFKFQNAQLLPQPLVMRVPHPQ